MALNVQSYINSALGTAASAAFRYSLNKTTQNIQQDVAGTKEMAQNWFGTPAPDTTPMSAEEQAAAAESNREWYEDRPQMQSPLAKQLFYSDTIASSLRRVTNASNVRLTQKQLYNSILGGMMDG